jgi:phosphopantothenoylcysteine decarboxylase/phosphopantothenate--cysteine ligase
MGYAVARNAVRRGARVILVSGPVNLPAPVGVGLIAVESARQMLDAVMANVGDCDAIIKAAAVADYRPEERKLTKIKKQAGTLTIDLVKNPDILLELGRMERRPLLVGFAAETCNLESYASTKLVEKNLDMIVANDVSQPDAGFNVENNRAMLIYRDGRSVDFELMSKDELSQQIFNNVLDELQRRKG